MLRYKHSSTRYEEEKFNEINIFLYHWLSGKIGKSIHILQAFYSLTNVFIRGIWLCLQKLVKYKRFSLCKRRFSLPLILKENKLDRLYLANLFSLVQYLQECVSALPTELVQVLWPGAYPRGEPLSLYVRLLGARTVFTTLQFLLN